MPQVATFQEADDREGWWELRSPYDEGFVIALATAGIPPDLKEWQNKSHPEGPRWLFHESAVDKVSALAARYYDLEVG